MNSNRLEAFSDGVLAIIITIMVLELKVPKGNTIESLKPLLPTLATYVFSFINLGTYWNNHHHLMQASSTVNGKILWANLHLLFWLSLFPFATGYISENHFQEISTALYGFVLLMASIAWYILLKALQSSHTQDTILHKAYGRRYKAIISIVLYACATAISFVNPFIAIIIYVLVAISWFIPNRKMEGQLEA